MNNYTAAPTVSGMEEIKLFVEILLVPDPRHVLVLVLNKSLHRSWQDGLVAK